MNAVPPFKTEAKANYNGTTSLGIVCIKRTELPNSCIRNSEMGIKLASSGLQMTMDFNQNAYKYTFYSCHENKPTRTKLEPVYTKHPHQRCYISAMMLAILFSLKTMESLENGFQPQSGATPLFSLRKVSLES